MNAGESPVNCLWIFEGNASLSPASNGETAYHSNLVILRYEKVYFFINNP